MHLSQYELPSYFYTYTVTDILPTIGSGEYEAQANSHCIREVYTSCVQKGPMWVFPVLGFAGEEKLRGKKCCDQRE